MQQNRRWTREENIKCIKKIHSLVDTKLYNKNGFLTKQERFLDSLRGSDFLVGPGSYNNKSR